MAASILKAEKLSRTLDGEIKVTLVKEADFQAKAGEFVSITGPSGSGKSSLLYLLGLLDRPTSGRIYIEDEDVLALNDERLAKIRLAKMGFVFQFHFLLPEFSALENVMIPMKRLGKLNEVQARERGEELLCDLDLKDQIHKLPRQMSGGQCQRVAIARALANDPILILADEPTGNLDSVSSQTVQEILRKLAHERGRTVVAVTHDMDFAASADRQVRIVDGRIV